ncbi:MAG: hypothetical protein LKKZDAJK_002440 [Candidatus Fervidibacter sp.]
MRRLFIATLLGLVVVGVLAWWWKSHSLAGEEARYAAAKAQIVSLQRIRGTRPFTPEEMASLRQFLRDPNWQLRMRALTALWDVRDPSQRQEAIQLATEQEVANELGISQATVSRWKQKAIEKLKSMLVGECPENETERACE